MVRPKIVWTREAKIALVNILVFYKERNGSNTYSKKLYNEILKTVDLLKANPFMGKQTEKENIRVIVHKNYLIYYTIGKKIEVIEIITLFDGRTNWKEK